MLVAFSILQNAALLSVCGLGIFLIHRIAPHLNHLTFKAAVGVALGLTAFLVSINPVVLPDGATLDARAGPVILSAVVAGPLGAIAAATIGGAARAIVGGDFVVSGIAVYAIYAALGYLLCRLRLVDRDPILTVRTITILCLASFLGALSVVVLIHPTERAVDWLATSYPKILLANALSVAFTIFVVDLALRMVRSMEQTHAANETLNLAKRAGGFGIWDYDIKNDALAWDDRSKEIHGVAASARPKSYEEWRRIVLPDDIARIESVFQAALRGERDYDAEYRVRLPNGAIRVVKGNAVILRDRAGQPKRVVGTNLDLTSLRATEGELDKARSVAVQAQKFDTIGKLTGGVAHDFNNLLAVIMGNLELLKDEIDSAALDKAEAHALIDSAIQAVKRGADLTNSMLAYARQARLAPTVLNVNDIVRETEGWMRRTIETNIEIEMVLQGGIWPVLIDRSSLQSALVNLIVNARDAMPGGGKLTLETANVRIDETYLEDRTEAIPTGRYVMIAVSDNGEGMDADVIERIFDPFFTTKPVGKGTGLGLSMVEGFVRQTGGTIRVYSEPGAGTSFKLYFRAAEQDEQASETPTDLASANMEAGRAGLRVLVAEDRADVMVIIRKILVNAGYDVTVADNGDTAYAIFEADSGFDLVVTDIVMPGNLLGPALAKACRLLRPDIPFIFLSGYASEATVHGNGLRPEDVRLMKPVSRADLLKAVQTTLKSDLNKH